MVDQALDPAAGDDSNNWTPVDVLDEQQPVELKRHAHGLVLVLEQLPAATLSARAGHAVVHRAPGRQAG